MKKILLSVHPKYCKLIFNGKKTIEVRRPRPKLEPPFEVLVYCTKQMLTKTKGMYSYLHKNEPKACKKYGEIATWANIGDVQVNSNTPWSFRSYGMHGKVIGSFICDKIEKINIQAQINTTLSERWTFNGIAKQACLTAEQLKEYLNGGTGYGWHITEPKLFDKPKLLSDFYIPCKYYEKGNGCPEDCGFFKQNGIIDRTDDFCEGKRPITRPPQSFCYVEDINEI